MFWQVLYNDIKESLSSIQFVNGLPNKDKMEILALQETGHKVLVINDLLRRASKSDDVVDLCTKFSHHFNFTVYFIVHNLFTDGKQFRTIALNSHYLLLFVANTNFRTTDYAS